MTSSSALVALLVVGCAAVASAMELTFYVGDAKGWTTGVDYTAWAKGQAIEAKDTLVFRYDRNQHTVTEVTKSNYDACAVSATPVSDFRSGLTIFSDLKAGTSRYFICTVGNHCAGGMKLAVAVSNSSSGDVPRAQPWSPPRSTGGASAHLHAGNAVAAAAVGVLVKLALF
ncbi:mavicyanin-like [Oryza brachyantha]|uniref:Phytocyanin domain-containing protein n=1 Tax=Oryza brachyantha TaxID=4533 RepID=J3MTX1_ORYBR|nr:mavicyanin-like [Oryza brachyantha]